MARHAFCDTSGNVKNVIIWDGREFTPPEGYYIIQHDTVAIGDVLDTNTGEIIKKYYEKS